MSNKTILKITLGFFIIVLVAISAVLVDAVVNKDNTYHQAEYITELSAYQQTSPQPAATQVQTIKINTDSDNYGQDDKEDNDEDDLTKEELATLKTEITQQEAIVIATNLVSGKMTDVEIERKKGHEVYAVEIDDDGDEVDVFVDIKTGQIIGTERDSEEDEEDDD